jgi:hypothetical protein
MNALRANHHQRTFAANCIADNAVSVMGRDRAVNGLYEEARSGRHFKRAP